MRALLLGLVMGCGGEADSPAPLVEDKCPTVALDNMAGDWLRVDGSKGDKTHRFRLMKDKDGYRAWFVNGFFKKIEMQGSTRKNDVMFTEVPSAAKRVAVEAGEASLDRIFVEPRKATCSLRVSYVSVGQKEGKEVEKPTPGFSEYLPLPDTAKLSFQPPTETLFLAKAAQQKSAADAQVAKLGGADPATPLGEAIPVGMWSDAAADGDPSCTYDMALFFDDVAVKDRDALPAGEVKDGLRHWYVADWYAPFSGNHNFEVYRYRTCGGGARELIAVAGLEAVLE